jgi:hypothetical protein
MLLDLDAARKLVTPVYDALTRPGEKDVEALIKSVGIDNSAPTKRRRVSGAQQRILE